MSFQTAETIDVATPAELSSIRTVGAGPGGLFAGYADGTRAFVASNGFTYVLQTNASASNGVTVLSVRDDSTRRWVGSSSAGWAGQTVWFLDPSNTSGFASDLNTGLTAATPLLTVSEHAQRLRGAVITVPVAVTLMSDQLTGDVPYYNCEFAGTGTLTITGTPVPVFASTVTGYTPCTVGSSATDDNQLVDTAVPGGSWTAAGALVKGVIVRRTSGTVIQCFAMKDLGSFTLRVSQPINNLATTTQPNFAPGDTYEVTRLPVLKSIGLRYPTTNQFAFVLSLVQYTGATLAGAGKIEWFTAYFTALVSAGAGTYFNSCFNGPSFAMNGTGASASWNGGCCFIGSGNTRYEWLGGALNSEGNIIHCQGARLLFESSTVVMGQVNIYDTTNNALQASTFSRVQLLGFLNGKGNTSKMAVSSNAGFVTFASATLVNAASTTDPTPYQASSTVSAAPIPLQTNGSGVFQI